MPTFPFFTRLFLLLAMTALSVACNSNSEPATPKAVIQKKIILEGVPSASGIEQVGNRYYLIGDDSPYLFSLNEQFEVVGKMSLMKPSSIVGERIPKLLKPDFESIAAIMLQGHRHLLILGSGATAARNTAYLVPMTGKGPGKPIIISLEKLYAQLRGNQAVTGGAALNIEGLTADEEYLYLLQRFAPGGQNVLITYNLAAVEAFLLKEKPAPAPAAIQQWALPDLKGIKTGFSGLATVLGGKLLFTASAEETPDAILDGEVYGSMVGLMQAHRSPSEAPAQPDVVVPITEADGTVYKSKIESIHILKQHRRSIEAVAVADNDDGISELVLLTFSW